MANVRRDVAIAGTAIVLLAALVLLQSSLVAERSTVPSTYDTGARGYAALYELLSREHVAVDRFEEPIARLSGRGTLVIAGSYEMLMIAPSASDRKFLDTWVRRGGSLAIFGLVPFWMRPDLELPAARRVHTLQAQSGCGLALRNLTVSAVFTGAFAAGCARDRVTLLRVGRQAVAIAYRHGKGTILYSVSPGMFDNAHLAERDNARFAYAILAGRRVSFDEYGYGHTRATHFWQAVPVAMRIAVALAAAVLFLAAIFENLPFAPAAEAALAAERDSREYILSVAHMLQRAGAGRAVVQRLCRAVEFSLQGHADERARLLLNEAKELEHLPDPGTGGLMHAGRLFARVRKEYPW